MRVYPKHGLSVDQSKFSCMLGKWKECCVQHFKLVVGAGDIDIDPSRGRALRTIKLRKSGMQAVVWSLPLIVSEKVLKFVCFNMRSWFRIRSVI